MAAAHSRATTAKSTAAPSAAPASEAAATVARLVAACDAPPSVFAQAVYVLTTAVPAGCVTTYGEIAKALGRGAGGSRAVGSALARNPFAPTVPCHRVLKRGGGGSGSSVSLGECSRHAASISRVCGEALPAAPRVCSRAAGGFSGFAEGSTGSKADTCFDRKTALLTGEGVRLRRSGGVGGVSVLVGGLDISTGAPLSAAETVWTAADFDAADVAAAVALVGARE